MKKFLFIVINVLNTFVNGLLNQEEFKNVDFSHFKIAVGGGMAVQDAVATKWKEITGVPLAEGYGLTETAPLLAGVNPRTIRLESTGPAVEGVELKINSPDKVSGEGEIWARGPNIMKGYYKEPGLTKEMITTDGWLKTGDLGVFDLARLFQRPALDPLGQQRARRDCRSATVGLELRILDDPVIVDLDLQTHDVTTGWCTHHPGTHVRRVLVQYADVARVFVVIDDLVAVSHFHISCYLLPHRVPGEGGGDGPTICFRGLDNLAYYRTSPFEPGSYVNDTGCGNTMNADHPRVRELVIESLAYYTTVMGVDGFRFDLATILGRRAHGFSKGHPLLLDISNDPRLANTRLIAEPWDPGPGGYQLGNFPPRWAEWNDIYRDVVRQFWRGDHGKSGPLARRLHGSADIFESGGRGPQSSVNFVTAHDGFTLYDAVSYVHRHNEANGEDNRDGHAHNYSCNHGVEGETDDDGILEQRRRHRLNLLATLLFSQGTPMLLGGDEVGNSQLGNNNAYAQDNDTGWVDWSGLDEDPEFVDQVRELIYLRRENPLLRLPQYAHGTLHLEDGVVSIDWINQRGDAKQSTEWAESRAFAKVISRVGADGTEASVAIFVNAHDHAAHMRLTRTGRAREWRVAFCSAGDKLEFEDSGTVLMPGQAIALLLSG